MLDIKFIRENTDIVKQALIDKCIDLDIDLLLSVDKQIIAHKQAMEAELQKRNALSREMPTATPERKAEIKELSKKSGQLAAQIADELKPLEAQFQELIERTPTIPAPDVPKGKRIPLLITLGYPDCPTRSKTRKTLEEISSWNCYKKH